MGHKVNAHVTAFCNLIPFPAMFSDSLMSKSFLLGIDVIVVSCLLFCLYYIPDRQGVATSLPLVQHLVYTSKDGSVEECALHTLLS